MNIEEDYLISDKFLSEIRDQFKLWAAFLNSGIGLLSFTLAVACLGTNVPWFNALLSMLVIICIRVEGRGYFPEKVSSLRKIAKEDEKAKIILKGLENEFLSYKSLITGYPIFIVGFIFLSLILISPILSKSFPVLGNYFGI